MADRENEAVLFIGGVADGKKMPVEDKKDRVYVPTEKGRDTYSARYMTITGEYFTLMVEVNLRLDQAFQMLIDRYAQSKEQ